MALPMAAAHAAGVTRVNDCMNATQSAPYSNGCSFNFYDGDGNPHVFGNYQYKDVVTPSGNETEVFTGTAAPNGTGSVVTYNSANTPGNPGQTALSMVTGNTTTNWTMTIQPDGQWNLTANFHK